MRQREEKRSREEGVLYTTWNDGARKRSFRE